jgi:hypothetical protein
VKAFPLVICVKTSPLVILRLDRRIHLLSLILPASPLVILRLDRRIHLLSLARQ